MSTNRIQKLLFSEYCDFEDMVLVESPFAETSREGHGVRQVHLGLTPTKLVLATDILPFADDTSILFTPGLDPDIETLELVAVYPIDCVNLSVFHRRKTQSLKARFCNNKVLYFELGGFEKRNMFWNLWCERLRFLNPEDSNFSHSETSVATSTSNSTLYLVSSKRFNNKGTSQIWCQYASGDFIRSSEAPKWPDKHLYMGKIFEETPLGYTPVQGPITEQEFMAKKCKTKDTELDKALNSFRSGVSTNNASNKQLIGINRFQSGVAENCNASLFLPMETSKKMKNLQNPVPDIPPASTFNHRSIANQVILAVLRSSCLILRNHFIIFKADTSCMRALIDEEPVKFAELANSAVRLWEMQSAISIMSLRGRHRRRYAFTPHPHFYRGLGPWNVNQGERFTLQMKRAVSSVSIRRQPNEPELRLSVSRRQLIAAISCGNLYEDEKHMTSSNTIRNTHKMPIIFFWTPEYWYRPQSAREAYQELQMHLNRIKEFQQLKECFRRKFSRKRNMLGRGYGSLQDSDAESVSQTYFEKVMKTQPHAIMKRVKPKRSSYKSDVDEPQAKETSIQFLKRILKMEMALCAWDFDSQVIANQLTLIDKDLFLRIVPEELPILLWQQSSRNAPNVSAFIAFSHRVSCLVATEVLKDDSVKLRARLITRFINVAEKCNCMNNFQSCRSILSGLQTPAIYRLHSSWNYVRKRHSTRYEVFEELCRLYRDPRLPLYQSKFAEAVQSNAYLPFIGDIISKLLDIIPATNSDPVTTSSGSSDSLGLTIAIKSTNKDQSESLLSIDKQYTPSFFKKIITSIKVWHSEEKLRRNQMHSSEEFTVRTKKRHDDFKTSVEKYKQLFYYEDNREERLQECIRILKTYQEASLKYKYEVNELAREYLLKSRYREDRDNFVHSFTVEPPLIFDK